MAGRRESDRCAVAVESRDGWDVWIEGPVGVEEGAGGIRSEREAVRYAQRVAPRTLVISREGERWFGVEPHVLPSRRGSKPPPPGRARNWGDRVGFVGGPEEDLRTGRRYWYAHVEGKRSVLDEQGWFASAEDAVSWALLRAPIVGVRGPDGYAWAGEERAGDQWQPRWRPGSDPS
jgi:hypothetical protein